MQLLFGWCCHNDSWVRKTGNEPQEHRCLKTSLSNTLSGFNAYLWVCSQVSSCLCLPFIWFEIQNFPKNMTGSSRHKGMLSSRNSENAVSSIMFLFPPCFHYSFSPCTNNLIALAFSGNLLLLKSQLRKCFNSLGLL